MVANAWLLLGENSVLLCDSPCTPLCAAQHGAARHQARTLLVLKGWCWEWILAWDPLHRAWFGALTSPGVHPSSSPSAAVWVAVAVTVTKQCLPLLSDRGARGRRVQVVVPRPEKAGYCCCHRHAERWGGLGGRREREGMATVKRNHALIPSKLWEEGKFWLIIESMHNT